MKLTHWISSRTLYTSTGDIIPRGWGYCRPSVWQQDFMLIAPIPLNYIIGFGHWFYWRVLVRGFAWRGNGFEALRQHWFHLGERRGYDQGYEAGIRHSKAIIDRAFVRRYTASHEQVERALEIGRQKAEEYLREVEQGAAYRVHQSRRDDGGSTQAGEVPEGSTHREGSAGAPCFDPCVAREMSEGVHIRRSDVRLDTLDHDDHTNLDCRHGDADARTSVSGEGATPTVSPDDMAR